MSGGRAFPRRALWLLVVVLGGSFLLLRPRSAQTRPVQRQAIRPGSGEQPFVEAAKGRAPGTHQIQRQRQQQGILQGLRSPEQQDSDSWGWDWVKNTAASRVKERLGWKVGYSDEEDNDILDMGGQTRDTSFELEDESLTYRNHLEKEHSPHTYSKHSPTLTFGHIYVVSLPHRTDRRTRMKKIAKALGFEFTFVDATSKTSPIIGWIAERVKEVRQRKLPILAKALQMPEEKIGGMGVTTPWLKSSDRRIGLKFPDLTKLDERWRVEMKKAPNAADDAGTHLTGDRVVDWVAYLETTDNLDLLKPSSADLNVTDLLFDPVEPLPARQINDAVIATWYSQTRAWKKIIENKDSSALILEDDVDLEWDIERIWPNVERALPAEWEIVFLGHCWGRELAKAQFVHPQLHKATEPRCLHGYALSQKGAQHLVALASDPWRAYQTPIDTLIPYLTRSMPAEPKSDTNYNSYVHAFSMEPAAIIQSKELSSDIQEGVGSTWRGLLADSTWDRILRDEGQTVKQMTWDDIKSDPAIKPRPWGDWKKPKKVEHSASGSPDAMIDVVKSPFDNNEGGEDERSRPWADMPGLTDGPEVPFDKTAEEQAAEAAALVRAEEAMKQQKAALREAGMNRPVDTAERELEQLLQNLPKKPAALLKGKNRNKPVAEGGNKDHAAAELQAVVDALKKGVKPPKGDTGRVGTGPKRLPPKIAEDM